MDNYLESLVAKADVALKLWSTPSMSVGIIKDGKVIFCRGFGKRDMENGLPADEKTLYMIGSCSKAFTATLCMKLQDEGLLNIDRPIREYCDDVRFYDDFASREVTLRDLLSHRTGMPRHEFSWYRTPYTREEMVHNFRYLEPNHELRDAYQYCNGTFVMAGYICERVTGKTWEELVREYIFEPLHMDRTYVYLDDMEEDEDHSLPYQKYKKIPYYRTPVENREKGIGAPYGPAGSIISCAEDMLKWVNFHLHNNEKILKESSFRDLHQPQKLLGIPYPFAMGNSSFDSYGFGWHSSMYYGHKFLDHTGGIDGYVAYTAFVPDLDLGVVCYTNSGSSYAGIALGMDIVGHYLGHDTDLVHVLYKEEEDDSAIMTKMFAGEKIEGTSCSRPLNEFAGTYSRNGYTDIVIESKGQDLYLHIIGYEVRLEHYHYDTFFTAEKCRELPKGLPLSFEKDDHSGDIGYISIPLVMEPGAAPLKFYKKK